MPLFVAADIDKIPKASSDSIMDEVKCLRNELADLKDFILHIHQGNTYRNTHNHMPSMSSLMERGNELFTVNGQSLKVNELGQSIMNNDVINMNSLNGMESIDQHSVETVDRNESVSPDLPFEEERDQENSNDVTAGFNSAGQGRGQPVQPASTMSQLPSASHLGLPRPNDCPPPGFSSGQGRGQSSNMARGVGRSVGRGGGHRGGFTGQGRGDILAQGGDSHSGVSAGDSGPPYPHRGLVAAEPPWQQARGGKRKKNKGRIGTGVSNNLTGVARHRSMYVGRLQLATSIHDVWKYMEDIVKLVPVEICKLQTTHNDYACFYVKISDQDYRKFLNPRLWPQHVVIRDFDREEKWRRLMEEQGTSAQQ